VPIVIDNANVPLYLENYQYLKIKDKNDLVKSSELIIKAINCNKNLNTINNELNYLNKEKILLEQMIKLEETKRKLKNKYQGVIFSITISIFIMVIVFLNIIAEKANILSGILYALYGLSLGIFLSIAISEIKKIRKKNNDR